MLTWTDSIHLRCVTQSNLQRCHCAETMTCMAETPHSCSHVPECLRTCCKLHRHALPQTKRFPRAALQPQHLPRRPTRSRLPPPPRASFSEEWARELCSSPLDSRLYINSWEVGSSSRLCFLFVCPPPLLFPLAVLSLVENKETEALFMPLLNLLCSSVSVYLSVPGPQQATVLPCYPAESSFHLQSAAIFRPPPRAQTYCT